MNNFEKLYFLDNKIKDKIIFENDKILDILKEEKDFLIVKCDKKVGLLEKQYNNISLDKTDIECIGVLPNILAKNFGSKEFCDDYGLKHAYMGGSMANEISNSKMVISLVKNGFLCSLGTGGVRLDRVEKLIQEIKKEMPEKIFCCNILNSPQEPEREKKLFDLYEKYDIHLIEASAFINLSEEIVRYRLKGLYRNRDGNIVIKNKIIAKISRDKIAKRFFEPASKKIVNKLLEKGLITEEEAKLSEFIPMADDVTAEADSGGHTDNRHFTALFTVIKNLRDEMQNKYNFSKKTRVGLGGGISTPESMLAAFEMGADYVVVGSINQVCQEAGTSDMVKDILASAEYTDVDMAPAADMFELGVKVQVLKKGSMYSVRAKNMYDIYMKYNSIDEISQKEKEKIENEFLLKSMEEVWNETKEFFKKINNLDMIEKAENDSKKKMALIFRWYLGQSPTWARKAIFDRKFDFQIWCGPSLGAFNDWVKHTELKDAKNRFVSKIAELLFNEMIKLKKKNFLRDFYSFNF